MRGHLRKRSKGSWSIVLDIGRDTNGKRRQRWHTVRGTRRDAERELTRLLGDVHGGSYVQPSRVTVGEHLEQWLLHVEHRVAPKTFERYADIVRGQLAPALGSRRLSELRAVDIQSAHAEALRSGRKRGPGGLSPQTVIHHHRVLRKALENAVQLQLLSRNPADGVELPRVEPREMLVLDEIATRKLMDAAATSDLRVPIALGVATGMRRGEILGLRWADVDLDAGTLQVRQSAQQTRSGVSMKAPKTAKGRRRIDLPGFLVRILREHRAVHAEVRLALGPNAPTHDLVCIRGDGSPIRPDELTSRFKALARRVGLGGLRLHDLRHGHATHLLRQGVHPKVVSERLGHSSIGITLDTYSHVLPGMQREAADLLDASLGLA